MSRKRAASTRGGDAGFAVFNYVELECVPPSSQVRYKALAESFLRGFRHSHPKKCRDGPADQAMAEFTNRLYLRSHESKVGDKLVAAWAVFFPDVSKQERRPLSRVTQTLKG